MPFSPFEAVEGDLPTINATAFETAEIIAYVAGLGEIQRVHVYRALQAAYGEALAENEGAAAPTVSSFAQHLEAVEAEAKGRHARERVRQLTDFGLFADAGEGIFDPRSSGMVIDLSRIQLEQVQLAAGAFLLRRIYREMFLGPRTARSSWPSSWTRRTASRETSRCPNS